MEKVKIIPPSAQQIVQKKSLEVFVKNISDTEEIEVDIFKNGYINKDILIHNSRNEKDFPYLQ